MALNNNFPESILANRNGNAAHFGLLDSPYFGAVTVVRFPLSISDRQCILRTVPRPRALWAGAPVGHRLTEGVCGAALGAPGGPCPGSGAAPPS